MALRYIFNHVVEDQGGPGGMDAVFHALAHGTRRSMLRRLAGGELTVGELAEPLAISLAAASKHVRVLEQAACCGAGWTAAGTYAGSAPRHSPRPRPGCTGMSRSGTSGSTP